MLKGNSHCQTLLLPADSSWHHHLDGTFGSRCEATIQIPSTYQTLADLQAKYLGSIGSIWTEWHWPSAVTSMTKTWTSLHKKSGCLGGVLGPGQICRWQIQSGYVPSAISSQPVHHGIEQKVFQNSRPSLTKFLKWVIFSSSSIFHDHSRLKNSHVVLVQSSGLQGWHRWKAPAAPPHRAGRGQVTLHFFTWTSFETSQLPTVFVANKKKHVQSSQIHSCKSMCSSQEVKLVMKSLKMCVCVCSCSQALD